MRKVLDSIFFKLQQREFFALVNRSVPFSRVLAVCCVVLLRVAAFGAPEAPAAPTNRTPDRVVSRFRIGPLFEYSATREGGTFWALRPFYSRVSDPVSDTRVTDAAWPLGTSHRNHEQQWWRMLLAYGSDNDVGREESAWKAALFPLYFQGRTRHGEDYWALFPVYGHLPHVLLMDDIDFVLFPLYMDYRVNRMEFEYYLWPIILRSAVEPGVTRTGVFPLYGQTQRHDTRHRFAFWPFWTSAVYSNPRNTGSSWMLFPLAGSVNRAKEKQRLFLPPFFSHATTDAAERWRLPWPFYETVTTATSQKRSYWPFYGDAHNEDGRRWYAAWPLIEHFTLKHKGGREERSRFFPFYLKATNYRSDSAGAEQVSETYTRAWPFFARQTTPEGSHLSVLELSLIRYSGGIERNWAPFWTLYERIEQGSEVVHDALWGLLQYRTTTPSALSKGSAP
jgi:hypothetical protein